jgi:uncharacterized protein (DUF433 family)
MKERSPFFSNDLDDDSGNWKKRSMIDLSSYSQKSMEYNQIITIEPGKRSGKPCIRGMRITVYDILEYLAGGMTEAEVLEDFSELTSQDIKACLAFAADRERKLFVATL